MSGGLAAARTPPSARVPTEFFTINQSSINNQVFILQSDIMPIGFKSVQRVQPGGVAGGGEKKYYAAPVILVSVNF
jgi:hypothetical protein